MSGAAALSALLREAGAEGVPCAFRSPERSSARAWAHSGALWLTGDSDDKPVLPTAPVASFADVAAAAVDSLVADTPASRPFPLDGARLLGERAALAGLGRRGRIAAGGTCRLVRCRDGWVGVNLARGAEDLRLLPTWLEAGEPLDDPWHWLEETLAHRSVLPIVERARLLGMAVAAAAPGQPKPPPWRTEHVVGDRLEAAATSLMRVADLTSLWAGPLCGDLLVRAGGRVSKIESRARPDGTRAGAPSLDRLLNGGKRRRACDFRSEPGRRQLRRWLDEADVVLEASRPRGLQQLGIDAASWVAGRPGRIWCSITAYGRSDPHAQWIGLGDDVAVSAGLAQCVPTDRAPLFVADAPADPITGLLATVAVLAARRSGGGVLLDIPMQGCIARAISDPHLGPSVGRVRAVASERFVLVDDAGEVPVCEPWRRPISC